MAAGLKLPDSIRVKVFGENLVEEEDARNILNKLMKGGSEPSCITPPSKFFLQLEKQADRQWPKPPRHKRKTLSYVERRKLGLYSLGKKSLTYDDLLPLNGLWKDYMINYLNLKKKTNGINNFNDITPETLSGKLFRADYHGAELLVERSKCPGYVGKCGIVAMETKNCFMMVGKDNITRKIPKFCCQFSFFVKQYKFTFFGKNFISRPAERSSKKIKTIYPLLL